MHETSSLNEKIKYFLRLFIRSECTEIYLELLGVYLTERTIKLLGERCPHLKVLNLHDASYLMTDHFMEMLCKVTYQSS